ncbi:MAG TPA: hypothetical protein VGM30_22380 [Puia sp.]|jgi:hypothetical protein
MKKLAFLSAIVSIFLCACGPTVKLSSSWRAPDAAHQQFNKILVLVIAPAKYSDAGRIGEQQLAAELKANGINAVSAQDEFGPNKFRNEDEQTVLAKLRKSGDDAIIVTSLLDVEKEKRYVQGAAWPPPYYGRFWGYYSFWYARTYDQGYYETTKKYYLETNLYQLANNKLLYSVQSQTIDPGSPESVAKTFSKLIVKDMKAKQVI